MTTNTLKSPKYKDSKIYNRNLDPATPSFSNELVQDELQKVQNSLYDIKRLTNLYHQLHRPGKSNSTRKNSYPHLKDLHVKEVGHALISQLDVNRLFPLINNLTTDGTGSTTGVFLLVSEDEIIIKAMDGVSYNVASKSSFKTDAGIFNWVIKYAKPLLVDDIDKDPRFGKHSSHCLVAGKTVLCVPVKVQDKAIGIISVSNKKSGEPYDDNDIRFLETIASYASISLGNSSLFKKLKSTNKLDQLTSFYYDENNRYIPATLRSIKRGAFAGNDLYLQTSVNNEVKYLLYCKGFQLLEDERKESFVKKNINRIYVAKNGSEQYLRYMEMNLEQIVHDEMIELHERTRIAYDVATNIIRDTFRNPGISVVFERAKDWATIILDFIQTNKDVHSHLLSILSYSENLFKHSVNTAILGTLFGHYLGHHTKELLPLCTGMLLHDIGKTNSEYHTGKKDMEILTKEEREAFMKHTDYGYILLSKSNNSPIEARLIAKQHHERYNGKGFPEGLKGKEIHYFSRITHLIDEYELLMSKNSSFESNSAFHVLQYIVKKMDGSFDNDILKKFIGFLNFCTDGNHF